MFLAHHLTSSHNIVHFLTRGKNGTSACTWYDGRGEAEAGVPFFPRVRNNVFLYPRAKVRTK